MNLTLIKSLIFLLLATSSVFGWDRFGFSKDISPFYFKLRDQYHRLFNGIDDPRNKSKSFRLRNHEKTD